MPFLQVLNGILRAMRMSATPSVGNALGIITISQIIRVRTVCLKIRFFFVKNNCPLQRQCDTRVT
jgi:hypothetical protein